LLRDFTSQRRNTESADSASFSRITTQMIRMLLAGKPWWLGTQMESKLFGNPFLHQMKYYNAGITALAADVR